MNEGANNQPVILYIEDSPEDVLFLKYAFKRAAITNPVKTVQDGQEGIDYLAGRGDFSDRDKYPFPCLVLLDLMLPRKMGLEVLQWIREQKGLRKLSVIILSGSAQVRDVDRAYELGANAFLVKPSSSDVLADMAAALKHFWLTHNQPPECTSETVGEFAGDSNQPN